MKYLLGIDNGGTFAKAALFDEDGHQIASAGLPTNTITPKSGYTERDMEELWDVNACYKNNNHKIRNFTRKYCRYFFSGHGKGLYLVDKDGNPICWNSFYR